MLTVKKLDVVLSTPFKIKTFFFFAVFKLFACLEVDVGRKKILPYAKLVCYNSRSNMLNHVFLHKRGFLYLKIYSFLYFFCKGVHEKAKSV